MLTYKLRVPPRDYDANWLRVELENIVKAANASNDAVLLRTLNTAPAKAIDGELRIADGANWDVRFGNKMLAWYDSVDSEWKGVVHVGSGGTDTQTGTKSSQVTIDKDCGRITMNNAALAADTAVSFKLNNAKLGAGDVLILNHVSGGTLGAYLLNASCSSGSATIYVRNITTGSLSEAIVIRFVRIPGSTS